VVDVDREGIRQHAKHEVTHKAKARKCDPAEVHAAQRINKLTHLARKDEVEYVNYYDDTKKERAFGDFSFREGDRVMQIRNNYDIMWRKLDGSLVGTGIFNGDVGIISEIDPAAETLTVVYDDREADYGFDQLSELEPAYAMTVHKSQGSGATRSLVKS
jgi:ATP-dependent exoDNAse (exonuclease V) alpha subunit